jgi:hypothetical protein
MNPGNLVPIRDDNGEKDAEERKQDELLNAEERKGANTIIRYTGRDRISGEGHGGTKFSIRGYLQMIKRNPNVEFRVESSTPADPLNPYYTKVEIEDYGKR